jgi:hypothetical protein
MWTNNISDSTLKLSRKGLLYTALAKYQMLEIEYKLPWSKDFKFLSDKSGHIGIECQNFILVAKNYPYGDIVSVHKRIWNKQKKIIMYIDDSNKFYVFEPKEIKDTQENKRGEVTMVNFSIRNGLNIEKISEQRTEEEKYRKTMGW